MNSSKPELLEKEECFINSERYILQKNLLIPLHNPKASSSRLVKFEKGTSFFYLESISSPEMNVFFLCKSYKKILRETVRYKGLIRMGKEELNQYFVKGT